MTQNEKDLLLKDLWVRLPYRVICQCDNIKSQGVLTEIGIHYNMCRLYDRFTAKSENCCIFDCKPYLFPLSSMTEEQKKEISKRYNLHTSYGLCIEITNHFEGYGYDDNSCHLLDYLWLIDWFNENHFDYRGLISKGLAIDATGLNIY